MKKIRFAFLTAMILAADKLFACSVCFGDPNSPLTHGAKAAVLFLVGVVVMVLCSIVGVAMFWMHRARLLQVQAALHGNTEAM